ncbi:carbohydrate sulfotransferase 11-like [Glandiceps talaboti]
MRTVQRCFVAAIITTLFFILAQLYLANQHSRVDAMIASRQYLYADEGDEFYDSDYNSQKTKTSHKEDVAIKAEMRKRNTLLRCRCAEKKDNIGVRVYKYLNSFVNSNKSCPKIADAGHKFEENPKDIWKRRAKYKFVTPELYVDDKYKLIYCPVPKVATSNWRRVLMVLSGLFNDTTEVGMNDTWDLYVQKFSFKRFASYKPRERDHRLRTYTKVMFVRHPFERLLSAYRDKFEIYHDKIMERKYGTRIRTFVQPYLKERWNQTISFPDFVRYLVLHPKEFNADHHWRSYTDLCRPCDIEYDVIGKYETLTRDADYVLRKIGAEDVVKFPQRDPHSTNASQQLTVKDYFAKIDRSWHISKLLDLYYLDFRLFDYSWN